MTNDQTVWVENTRWSEGWACVERLLGGGQGLALRARRKSGECTVFLKVIKAKRDTERRIRFFREASAYNTIRASGIPRLIESNAHRWEDADVEPYIATEFIEGPTLSQWREAEKHVELDTAIDTARQLIAILVACHASGIVHRDIKPDNIILAEGDPEHPVLLDFGLNYHNIQEMGFATESEQEVGNRFLRLPELSAGSPLKQDPRSDLSFVAGILFYLLTGQNPDVLQDAEGRLPHQRPEKFTRLQQAAGSRLPPLLSLFDDTFTPQIADRVTSAEAMFNKLDNVMKSPTAGSSEEDLLQDIRLLMDNQARRRQVATQERVAEALKQVERVHNDVRKTLGFPVIRSQSNWNVSGKLGRNTLGWIEPGSNEAMLSVKYEVREAGDEIVISLSGEPVYRTSVAAPHYGSPFDDVVRRWLIGRLHNAVTNPHALPPEADNFLENQPFALLKDAQAEARSSRRNILAFVYDPTQEQRGRLQHGLGYFLQNRKTREIIHSAFVVALVPLSQVAAITAILDNESMESSRWIVFDQDLKPLEQKVIHANPQGGERIALDLANRFGP